MKCLKLFNCDFIKGDFNKYNSGDDIALSLNEQCRIRVRFVPDDHSANNEH